MFLGRVIHESSSFGFDEPFILITDIQHEETCVCKKERPFSEKREEITSMGL